MKTYKINYQLDKFNRTIDGLIKAFSRNNLDETSILFLAKRTRNLMSFTHMFWLHIIFRIFDKVGDMKYKFDEEVIDTNKIVDIIFEEINRSLENLISRKVDKDKQDDIDNIINNLFIFKDLFSYIGDILISILKFQSHNMSEDQFRLKYKDFKRDLSDIKNRLNMN